MTIRLTSYPDKILFVEYKDRIWYLLALLFFVTLFLPHAPVINNIVTGAILVYSFLYNTLKNKLEIIRKRPALWAIFAFNLLELVNALFSRNHSEALRILALRTPLIIFPLSMGTIEISLYMRNTILRIYSWIIVAVALTCLLYAIKRYGQTGDVQYFYNDNLTQIVDKQSIYVAFMITLAVAFFVFELLTYRLSALNKFAVSMAVIFLLLVQLLLASRAALFTLAALGLPLMIWHFLRTPFLWHKITYLILIVSAFLLIPLFFSRTLQRFRELQYTKFSYHNTARESHFNMPLTADQWNGANIRLAIWQCGLELTEQHFWLGMPLGDKRKLLYDRYREKGFLVGVETKKNLHNNYLDVFSNLGVFGFLAFITGFIFSPLIVSITRKDMLGTVFIIALAVVFVSETYFDRSVGCLLTGFFISLILASHKIKKDLLLVIC